MSVFFLGCVGFSCVLQKYSEKQPVKHIILSSRRPGLKEKKKLRCGSEKTVGKLVGFGKLTGKIIKFILLNKKAQCLDKVGNFLQCTN